MHLVQEKYLSNQEQAIILGRDIEICKKNHNSLNLTEKQSIKKNKKNRDAEKEFRRSYIAFERASFSSSNFRI